MSSHHFSLLAGAACLVISAAIPAQPASPEPLGLEEAARLALEEQPLVAALAAEARSAQARAVAEAQLPDPELSLGLADIPVSGPDRWSLERDSDTHLAVGLRQPVPAAAKRHWRGERLRREGLAHGAMARAQARAVRRDAALAWLGAWHPATERSLLEAAAREAQLEAEAAEIGYRSGRGALRELLDARIEAARLQDRLADAAQREWHARNELSRWIGSAAQRPLAAELPDWGAPDPGPLDEHLQRHPHLQAESRRVEVAQAELELAKAAYRPDWSIGVAYGHRADFPRMASVQLAFELPLFTAKRQDRQTEAARHALDASAQRLEDAKRQHMAQLRLNLDDWRRLQDRLQRYQSVLLPAAGEAVEAALAAYRSGEAPLLPVLQARRRALELQMERLALRLDAARHRIELDYYTAAGGEDHGS